MLGSCGRGCYRWAIRGSRFRDRGICLSGFEKATYPDLTSYKLSFVESRKLCDLAVRIALVEHHRRVRKSSPPAPELPSAVQQAILLYSPVIAVPSCFHPP